MSDQARDLRAASSAAAGTSTAAVTWPTLPTLAITGGKGGVGKTCIAVNLAIALAKLGKRPLLVDLDLGLANADVLLGVNPQRTLYDVVFGGIALAEVVVSAHGVAFVPAASGHDELTRLSQEQLSRLFASLGELARGYDLLILDTAAGIGREVTAAVRSARTTLVTLTPDPTSMTDAYALIKVLDAQQPGLDLRVVTNMALGANEGLAAYVRLRTVAKTYLKRELPLAGQVPRDAAVAEAVRRRKPLLTGRNDGLAAQGIRALAQKLAGERWRG